MKFSIQITMILWFLTNLTLAAADDKFNFTKVASTLVNAKGEKTSLNKKNIKFILVYYSSHWCCDCKRFTPELVKFYNKNSKNLFEVVFMSLDFSEESQISYMKNAEMPWPAVKFSCLKPSGLFKYAGCVMPWISVFKADGTWIPNSKLNLTNRTPKQVINTLKATITSTEDRKLRCPVKANSTKSGYAAL